MHIQTSGAAGNNSAPTALDRLRLALKTLRACHDALIRSSSDRQLLDAFCRNLRANDRYRAVWVATADPGAADTLTIIGYAGDGTHPLPQAIPVTGPIATALRDGRSLLENRLEEAAALEHGYRWMQQAGWGACAIVPLPGTEQAIGVLVAGREPADSMDTLDQDLLEYLARDLSEGLIDLRTRMERAHVMQALEESPDIVALLSADGQPAYGNAATLRMLGLHSQAEFTHRGFDTWQPEWAGRLFKEEGLAAAAANGVWQAETALLDKHGEVIPVSQLLVRHHDPRTGCHFFSTVLRDLRPHHKAAEPIDANESTYRRLLHAAREGLRLIDGLLARPETAVACSRLPVQKGNQILIFDLKDVCCLQADGHYTRVYTTDSDYLSTDSLSQLERQLDPCMFLRTHRSYIVNINHIVAVERNERQIQLLLHGHPQHMVPVSRRNADLVRKAIGLNF